MQSSGLIMRVSVSLGHRQNNVVKDRAGGMGRSSSSIYKALDLQKYLCLMPNCMFSECGDCSLHPF